jgi:hypothetical protein
VLELYFIFYRIPKIMIRLARERNRSALGWSLIGIGSWIGAELAVGFLFGLIQAVGVLWWNWPEEQPLELSVGTYVGALAAAIASFMIVVRILRGKKSNVVLPVPPPPPDFSQTDQLLPANDAR